MDDGLTFLPWRRSGLYSSARVDPQAPGRMQGELALDFVERNGETGQEVARRAARLPFEIEGPGDVAGLSAGAVTRMYPPPRSTGAESTFCAHVEFADSDLPWRFTPQPAQGAMLAPWLVLLVGTEKRERSGEIALRGTGRARVEASVLQAHDLRQSPRWAHVQRDAGDDMGPQIARLVSPRRLDPNQSYLAILVPAFDAMGAPRWQAGIGAPLDLPVYHHWRFQTGAAGDFRTLAQRLKPQHAPEGLGGVPLHYRSNGLDETQLARGALAAIGSSDGRSNFDITRDISRGLQPTGTDAQGRPITALPIYGQEWTDALRSAWGRQLNQDMRHRVAAGLGRKAAVAFQDTLVEETRTQTGDAYAAQSIVRGAGAGHQATRAQWRKRLPQDRNARLALLGPSFARLVGGEGSVLSRVTQNDSPLTPGVFSTAGLRMLRAGSALGRHAQAGATDPDALLDAANTCPRPPRGKTSGMPSIEAVIQASGDRRLVAALNDLRDNADSRVDLNALREYLMEGLNAPASQERAAAGVLLAMIIRQGRRMPLPILELNALLELRPNPKLGKQLQMWERDVRDAVARLDARRGGPDDPIEDPDRPYLGLFPTGSFSGTQAPCDPVDLDLLDRVVTAAFDPDGPQSRHRGRVQDRVARGPVEDPLNPVELCFDYDIPSWVYLRHTAADWLAPGAGKLAPDTVTALETNPTFIESYLLGLNTQLAEELRWRNVPLRHGCTPIRMFWGRIDPDRAEQRLRDIEGVESWNRGTPLGHPSHRTPEAGEADLVLLFSSEIFERYPQTVISLIPAPEMDGVRDWSVDIPPNSPRVLPSFLGRLNANTCFFGFNVTPEEGRTHWVVLEEPPSGHRFLSRAGAVSDEPVGDVDLQALHASAQDGAAFAMAALSEPIVVRIRGDRLIPDDT